jgi:GT2 family glycosyltransferase
MTAPAEPGPVISLRAVQAPSVTVVLVNWYSESDLANALAGLSRQTVRPEQVIVVDNGSAQDLPIAKYTGGCISVVRMPTNVGFAAANNHAIFDIATTEWIALLNPDAIPEPTWLECLLDAATSYPDVASFGSLQIQSNAPDRLDGLGDAFHVSGTAWRHGFGAPLSGVGETCVEVFSPCAAAALYRRDALLHVGGFDEDFFCYFEDVDLGFRLRLLGYRSMVVPTAIVHHVGGGSTGGGQSEFAVFHGHRNLVWCYVKNMPAAMMLRYLPQHLMFNLVSLAYFVFHGRGAAVLRAKWDALKGLRRMWYKRKAIQALCRVEEDSLLAAMTHGLWIPYSTRRRGELPDKH